MNDDVRQGNDGGEQLSDSGTAARGGDFIGLFMTALATLMYEILLTRIFSVTLWYHFAFMAISVAMFGMTVGALSVYLFPGFFPRRRSHYHLGVSALFFSVAIILSFLAQLLIPTSFDHPLQKIVTAALIYISAAVPFVFSGMCACLALTRFPAQVSRLYAYDLAGAAAGCILFKFALDITDGPTAVVLTAFLASGGALCFVEKGRYGKLWRIALVCSCILLLSVSISAVFVRNQSPLLRLKWVKGKYEPKPFYEAWNSFSRVTIEKPGWSQPFGWGLSNAIPPPAARPVMQAMLRIDANAGTILTKFDGDLERISYLKYDLTNLAHWLRSDASVLVVGTGGGRDILSSLAFHQKSVTGVEINGKIMEVVTKRFGDFTGHLDRNPKVTLVNDEARSYLLRHTEQFDIIQVSMIDTWAATAAGAFSLTENGLYTTESWGIFLRRLNPDGILTFSRWYLRDMPGEIYRLASLAVTSLRQAGVENPQQHIVVVRKVTYSGDPSEPYGVGTMLVSKEPFSEKDLSTVEKVAKKMHFDVVLSPRGSADPVLGTLVSRADLGSFMRSFPVNIAPPTDDSPFFFCGLRLSDTLAKESWGRPSSDGGFVLVRLLVVVVALTLLFIIVPLMVTRKTAPLSGSLPLFVFFASIGFGFMFIEISQMQRLNLFLGHPAYSLTVVLFTLLVAAGAGSYLTRNAGTKGPRSFPLLCLSALLFILLLFGTVTPYVISGLEDATTPVRIVSAASILFMIGLLMGMAFPLGMKLASEKADLLTPWFWGINGATSVCGSVLAVGISLFSGITATFWAGVACYAVALVSFTVAGRQRAFE